MAPAPPLPKQRRRAFTGTGIVLSYISSTGSHPPATQGSLWGIPICFSPPNRRRTKGKDKGKMQERNSLSVPRQGPLLLHPIGLFRHGLAVLSHLHHPLARRRDTRRSGVRLRMHTPLPMWGGGGTSTLLPPVGPRASLGRHWPAQSGPRRQFPHSAVTRLHSWPSSSCTPRLGICDWSSSSYKDKRRERHMQSSRARQRRSNGR